ncbi:hypothetical protein Lal_00015552 [Lupinus albus]|nr:hypothetical protein Lal_00015552 [Lupinus albus]
MSTDEPLFGLIHQSHIPKPQNLLEKDPKSVPESRLSEGVSPERQRSRLSEGVSPERQGYRLSEREIPTASAEVGQGVKSPTPYEISTVCLKVEYNHMRE